MVDVHYTVNTPRCIAETLDGETTVIDTETGAFYNLVGIGPIIWAAFARPMSSTAVAQAVAVAFPAEDDVSSHLLAFVADLAEVALIVPVTGLGDPPVEVTNWPETYAPPRMDRFTDVADIMTVDPIHEVDHGAGWPYRADS